jgi:hypothetical protein
MSKDTLYNKVKALLIKFGADQKAIDDLDSRQPEELQMIKNAYLNTYEKKQQYPEPVKRV